MSYIVSPDCVACDVQDGIAILNLKTNIYFGLCDVGAEVWSLLQQPASLSELAGSVSSKFEVEESVCKPDIANLLDQMSHNGLIVSA